MAERTTLHVTRGSATRPPSAGTAEWPSLLRTCRAAVAVLLFAAVGVLLPPQTRDMLAYLADGNPWQHASLHLALIFLGFGAWYWSRAALAARFGVDDTPQARAALPPGLSPGAFNAVPRILFLAAATIGLGVLAIECSWWNGLALLVWAVVGYLLLWNRVSIQRSLGLGHARSSLPAQCSRHCFDHGLAAGFRNRLVALLERGPLGFWGSLALLGFSFLCFAAGALESFSGPFGPGLAILVAQGFPGPSAALLGLGLMIAPLTALTFVADGIRLRGPVWQATIGPRRPPVLILLALWTFVAAPLLFDLHTVRIAQTGLRPSERVSLDEFFKSWADACAPTGTARPVIVAISGGATMAGLWGARVLSEIEDAGGAGRPSVFAVSSVSGGSLGAAAYMGVMANQAAAPCTVSARPQRATSIGLEAIGPQSALWGDALGPLLNGWLLGDIPRAIFALPASLMRWISNRDPRGGDSAAALEHAFEYLRAREAGASQPFSAPLTTLFYGNDKKPRPGMPVWISNGTDTTTGSRVLTAAFGIQTWPFGPTFDALGLLGADVPVSTAINNSARFPYLEPFGVMLPNAPSDKSSPHELIDGGYFENEGLQTALELAAWIRTAGPRLIGRPVDPIIVQATANGDRGVLPSTIVRCGVDGPGPIAAATRSTWQVLGPLVGLYSVRGGHSASLLREASRAYCGTTQRFFHFYLPAVGKNGGTEVPLNWVLSRRIVEQIWRALRQPVVGNERERLCLNKVLADPERAVCPAN